MSVQLDQLRVKWFRTVFVLEKLMKTQTGVQIQCYSFFNSGARRGGWLTPRISSPVLTV